MNRQQWALGRPAASVLLPVFNGGKYLESAVASVLEQTFTEFELLLLDDGSSDNSLQILRSFEKLDRRCVVLTHENRGLVATLNDGLARALGDIVIRMDADDRCDRRRFELQMAFLAGHPQCVAVGSEALLIDPEGRPLRKFGVPTDHAAIDDGHLQGLGGMVLHPTVAMRRAAVVAAGGYREQFKHAEDIDLFLRLAEVGQLANLPDVLVEYRQHLKSVGYRWAEEQWDSKTRAIVSARMRRGLEPQLPQERPDALSSRDSNVDVYRKWAWWALSAGHVATARRHALQAVRRAPFATQNLRLVACVLRGH